MAIVRVLRAFMRGVIAMTEFAAGRIHDVVLGDGPGMGEWREGAATDEDKKKKREHRQPAGSAPHS